MLSKNCYDHPSSNWSTFCLSSQVPYKKPHSYRVNANVWWRFRWFGRYCAPWLSLTSSLRLRWRRHRRLSMTSFSGKWSPQRLSATSFDRISTLYVMTSMNLYSQIGKSAFYIAHWRSFESERRCLTKIPFLFWRLCWLAPLFRRCWVHHPRHRTFGIQKVSCMGPKIQKTLRWTILLSYMLVYPGFHSSIIRKA